MICTYRTHFHTKTCFERDTRIHSSMSCSQEPLILIKISNLLPHIQNSDKNDMHTAMLLFMALSMPFSYTIIIIGGFRFSLIKRLNSQISILNPIQFIPTNGSINLKRTPPPKHLSGIFWLLLLHGGVLKKKKKTTRFLGL